jgi:cation transport regulator ChaB
MELDQDAIERLSPDGRESAQEYYARRFNKAWEYRGHPERRTPDRCADRNQRERAAAPAWPRGWPVHGAPAAMRSSWPEAYPATVLRPGSAGHGLSAHRPAMGAAKLTHEQADSVRRRSENGESQTAIARDIRVHRTTIGRLVRGSTYRPLAS